MRRTFYMMALAGLVVVPAQAQQFGAFTAIHDDVILVSEPVKQNEAATIRVYQRSDGGWAQVGTLMAPEHDGGDYFGRFVAMDDQHLIVGGTLFEESTGQVWVYSRNGTNFELIDTLRPDSIQQGNSFGRFGALHGDILAVSALGYNGGRGGIWVYRRDANGAWNEEAMLTPGADAPESEFFGWSIAFNGERLITGALMASQELQNRGAAYIFRRNGPGDWTQEARLDLGEDAEQGDVFGNAVGWLDGMALVGAPGRDGGIGEVYTYSSNSVNEWSQGTVLGAYERRSGARFGTFLYTDDDELWVGTPGAEGIGRVYNIAYDARTGRFGDVSKIESMEEDIGDNFGSMIAVAGNTAVIGSIGDDFGLGSATILERSGDSWMAVDKLYGPDPSALDPLVAGAIACEDGTADQFSCNNVDIVSFLPVAAIGGGRGANTNDVWGWTDPQTGKEIAIVGRTDGTAFIDVTNPASPVYLGNLPKTEGSRGNSWRDIKVYNNHAFIVADGAGNHGMQVFDLTRLRDVTEAPMTFDADVLYDRIASAHNIVINEASGTAYAVGSNSGGETCGGAFHMIDITQPRSPTFIGCFADTTTGFAGTGYSHDAMCINYDGPDTEYVGREICFGSNENALSIADMTDKHDTRQISAADYPNVGYAHQGWITEDHKYFIMNDEGDEMNAVRAEQPMPGTRTLIWDVQDLDDPIMVKEHFGTTFTIDHNLYIKGNLMYQSNYVSGLRILDISDPENPKEVGFLDTVPWSEEVEFDGSWSNYPFFESGTIVVSSGKEGIFFLKYRPQQLVP
jgi:choice-of-anchor B domain-containing protein